MDESPSYAIWTPTIYMDWPWLKVALWLFQIWFRLPRQTSWFAQRRPVSSGNHKCFRRHDFWTPARQKDSEEAKDEDIKKLTLKVIDKKKYVLHFSSLKFYLQHGPKLKQIHRIISLEQSNFLKPYIDFNTEKRRTTACTTSWRYLGITTSLEVLPSRTPTFEVRISKNHYPEKVRELLWCLDERDDELYMQSSFHAIYSCWMLLVVEYHDGILGASHTTPNGTLQMTWTNRGLFRYIVRNPTVLVM